ncbi:hypothetical protein JG687_00018977, partial [Phytophthora cactorum]
EVTVVCRTTEEAPQAGNSRVDALSAYFCNSSYLQPRGALIQHCKVTLGMQRHSLQPDTLETVLMLRANEAFWNAQVVNECT